MPQMDDAHQLAIVMSFFTLHNFIRLHDLGIAFIHQVEVMESRADHNMYDDARKKAMDSVRLTIMDEIWKSVKDNVELIEQIYEEEEEQQLTDYEDDNNS
ncbi:hypothetical protein OROMI_018648 [Orobanche minor]